MDGNEKRKFVQNIGLLHPTGYTNAGYRLYDDAQNLVRRMQDYITQNLYTCTNKILRGLGKMIQEVEILQPILMHMVEKVQQYL